MDDYKIIELYWARSEKAISETANKYGRYCHYIAFNILRNDADAEECVNDTWLKTWNAIPPKRPNRLQTFLGKITRNLSLNMYEKQNAEKRGGGQIPAILDELEECIPDNRNPESITDDIALKNLLNQFLKSLSPNMRKVFVLRYWYMCSVKEIAESCNMGESDVSVTLFRAREKLKKLLKEEDIQL